MSDLQSSLVRRATAFTWQTLRILAVTVGLVQLVPLLQLIDLDIFRVPILPQVLLTLSTGLAVLLSICASRMATGDYGTGWRYIAASTAISFAAQITLEIVLPLVEDTPAPTTWANMAAAASSVPLAVGLTTGMRCFHAAHSARAAS